MVFAAQLSHLSVGLPEVIKCCFLLTMSQKLFHCLIFFFFFVCLFCFQLFYFIFLFFVCLLLLFASLATLLNISFLFLHILLNSQIWISLASFFLTQFHICQLISPRCLGFLVPPGWLDSEFAALTSHPRVTCHTWNGYWGFRLGSFPGSVD